MYINIFSINRHLALKNYQKIVLLQIHDTVHVKYLINKAMFYRQHLQIKINIRQPLIVKKYISVINVTEEV